MKRICIFLACLATVLSLSAAKKVTWVIDAGHGGRDTGCEGTLTKEKDITLAVAKEVGRLVKKNISGVRVVYTREKDKYLTLQERCDIANSRGATLFISIHVNSASNQFARGTESFFATNVPLKGTQAGKSELLALLLQRQYLSHGREISRGVKQRELYVCEHTNMPSVLTEIGFISNLNEEAYLNSKDGQKELAEAIYKALAEWKDLTKDGTVSLRDLRKLRITHYAPISMTTVANTQTPAWEPGEVKVREPETKAEGTESKTDEPEPNLEEMENKVEVTAIAEEPEKVDEPKGVVEETLKPEEAKKAEEPKKADNSKKDEGTKKAGGKKVEESKKVEEPKKTDDFKKAGEPQKTEEAKKPYFAIQLMNLATALKENDYRLKGYKGVKQIPANGRFKIIYGHSESYKDIKNELVQVRETFPEAFIVAFMGKKQITTAEALQILK
ncbi:MAG: N-acetylmuramoyl-L-alanine amidase [Bacteroidaceae bacterium]|nr:N-acetylmuramoyl-L-alanine amidase [Bacteroidaceae bacterium]